jgi:hypothetical protein
LPKRKRRKKNIINKGMNSSRKNRMTIRDFKENYLPVAFLRRAVELQMLKPQ